MFYAHYAYTPTITESLLQATNYASGLNYHQFMFVHFDHVALPFSNFRTQAPGPSYANLNYFLSLLSLTIASLTFVCTKLFIAVSNRLIKYSLVFFAYGPYVDNSSWLQCLPQPF